MHLLVCHLAEFPSLFAIFLGFRPFDEDREKLHPLGSNPSRRTRDFHKDHSVAISIFRLIPSLFWETVQAARRWSTVDRCYSLPTDCPNSTTREFFAFSRSIAERNADGATCEYRMVVVIVACPSNSFTTVNGTPRIVS